MKFGDKSTLCMIIFFFFLASKKDFIENNRKLYKTVPLQNIEDRMGANSKRNRACKITKERPFGKSMSGSISLSFDPKKTNRGINTYRANVWIF